MKKVHERVKEMRQLLQQWSPENRPLIRRLNFTPADIVFGKRVAAILQQYPDCKKHTDEIMQKILAEISLDSNFRIWILEIQLTKLVNVLEFSVFRLPPQSRAAE